MLLFDLTPDRSASEVHTSLPENGNIRIELQFSKPLPESITCLLYPEYDSTVLVNFSRKVRPTFKHKMDKWQILCTLHDVNSFFDVVPSDLLPSSSPVRKPYTLIVNADPHGDGGSHWLAISLTPRSSSAYYFDSYGIVPLVPSIQAFSLHNCTIWDYNKKQLQGLTSDVWPVLLSFRPLHGQGLHPPDIHHAVWVMQADRWSRCSRTNLGPPCRVAAGVNAAAAAYKR